MRVKERYSFISESLLFEEVLKGSRMKSYHPFWIEIKDKYMDELLFDDLMRVQKIVDFHMKVLKRR